MCEADMFTSSTAVNRRRFAQMGVLLGAGVGLSSCSATSSATAPPADLAEQNVSFPAAGGTLDGYFVHPAEGSHPGVLFWPDIAGLRPANKAMAQRLAAEGYAVLVGNPYFLSVKGQQFADFDDFRKAGFDKVRPWMEKNTPEVIAKASIDAVAWLDGQAAVDSDRGMGAQGYCMTGGWSIRAAAAAPARVKAAASFHGAGLVSDKPTSPVNLIPKMADDSELLICIARNDNKREPGDKGALIAAAKAAGIKADIQVYPADHGWTVPDSPAYNKTQAEIVWKKLLAMYKQAL